MLLRSKNSKVIHTEHCGHLKNTKPENIISYNTVEEALADGCSFCKHCSQVIKKYRKEKKWIDKFCKENRMFAYLDSAGLKVVTPYGKWYIVSFRRKKLALYHKNTNRKNTPSPIKGYHYQSVSYSSYSELLRYIKQHDDYKKNNPAELKMPRTLRHRTAPLVKGSKAYKKMQRYEQKVMNMDRKRQLDFLFEQIETERGARAV